MAAPRRSYTIEEANALMPQVRSVLLQLAVEQRRMDTVHAEMHRHLAGNGDPASAAEASRLERETAHRQGCARRHAAGLGVQLATLRGPVDFPGEREGAGLAVLASFRSCVAFWTGPMRSKPTDAV